ncbi:MAG: hypothetical protein R2706_01965 [Acidimicrobiales bacterium]
MSGVSLLTRPLANQHDYLPAVRSVTDPHVRRSFRRTLHYVSIHVQGHPPLAVLLLWLMDQLGLGGETYATALVLTVASFAAPAM